MLGRDKCNRLATIISIETKDVLISRAQSDATIWSDFRFESIRGSYGEG